ncbi:hypothetical protein ACLMAJ_18805 [Nocardia sp. KC 131]|uniref:hypothetical protein n=1 Tax=Nocardia arseniciresistens TaxID=3392119 RepID=UPI00398F884A
MSNPANLVSEHTAEVAQDYGQFLLSGGEGDLDNRSDYYEVDLLDQAFASRPCAGDGETVLVLTPHQNNFEMQLTVQVWDARPPADRDSWQQVSEARLRIGDVATLFFESPTLDVSDIAPVPAGAYLIEVSGTGFLNYGWPGTTTPGDVWRIRLWPDDGSDPLPAQQWSMPGYGVPEDVPLDEHPNAAAQPIVVEYEVEIEHTSELKAVLHALPITTREQ